MQDYRKLEVWKRAHQLTLDLYREISDFPADERYALTSQIKRAAASIPANIAEGCGRSSNAELARFLYISMGSASELDYHLLLARDLTFPNGRVYERLETELSILRRMLNAFIQKVNAAK